MFKTRPAWAAISCAAAAAFVGCSLLSAKAPAEDLGSKLDSKEAKLAKVREHKGVLTTTISHYRDQIERLTKEVAALRTQEAAVQVRLNAKQAELDRSVKELDVARHHLAEVRARLERALVTLRERLVAIYETGTPDVLSVIVEAGGYDDLVNRTEYLNRIHGLDEAIVGRVRDLRDQIQAHGRAAAVGEAADRSGPRRDRRRRAGAGHGAVGAPGPPVRARLRPPGARGRAGQDRRASSRTSRATSPRSRASSPPTLESTSSAPLPAGPIRYGSGQLIWPVDGPVVSGFGMRWGRMHEGIDIAVPAGTPIRAADAGTVVLVQSESESGGYGNFTCLDHGGGLQTCYAHQSSVAVSSGQSVSQGDVIGYVGCTGHCFGDHLHFEVRIAGAPTDPLGYL